MHHRRTQCSGQGEKSFVVAASTKITFDSRDSRARTRTGTRGIGYTYPHLYSYPKVLPLVVPKIRIKERSNSEFVVTIHPFAAAGKTIQYVHRVISFLTLKYIHTIIHTYLQTHVNIHTHIYTRAHVYSLLR